MCSTCRTIERNRSEIRITIPFNLTGGVSFEVTNTGKKCYLKLYFLGINVSSLIEIS